MTFDWMDLANAGFEGFGAFFALNHARVLYLHKIVRGVSAVSASFFLFWGIFNIFYYHHLDQMFSWAAGIAMTCANAFYVWLILYYKFKEARSVRHDSTV